MRRAQEVVLPDGYTHKGYLGRGGQASVILAERCGEGEPGSDADQVVRDLVAVKCYERSVLTQRSKRNRVRREVCNLRRLKHPHIIELKALEVTPTDLCIVTEYQQGGTLDGVLRRGGPLPLGRAREYFQQLWLAVDFAHQMGVTNRDIKPANVLFRSKDDDYIVLCDFGLSKYEHSLQGPSAVGTRGYGAPELLLRSARDLRPQDLQRADAYSCGVTLFQMLYGVDRFPKYASPARNGDQPNHVEAFRSLTGNVRQSIDFPDEPEGIPLGCQDFLTGLLQPNPMLRTTVKQFVQFPWFEEELPEEAKMYNEELKKAHRSGEVNNHHLPTEEELIRIVDEAGEVAQ